MKKDKSTNIIIAVLIIINIALLFYVYKSRSEEHPATAHTQVDPGVTAASVLRGRIILQSKYGTGLVVKPSTILIDSLGKELDINSVVGNQKKLFFYFSNTHCGACIDEAIPYLDKLSKDVGASKVVLLANVENLIDMKAIKKKYEVHLPIYKVAKSDVESPAHDLGVPFLFVLEPGLHPSYFSVLERQSPEVSKDYIAEMKLVLADKGITQR